MILVQHAHPTIVFSNPMSVKNISEKKCTRINLLQEVPSSCLFSLHFVIPRRHLCMRIMSFSAIVEEHASSAHETLAYTTGTTSKHQRATWPELYPKSIVFLHICSVAYESVRSLATCLRLQCRMLQRCQKRSKKCISNSNFKNPLLGYCDCQQMTM